MAANIIAKVTGLALLASLGVLATHRTQFVFAAPLINPTPHTLKIQDGNSSGWSCGSNCHLVSNSGYSQVQSAYRLTVHILSHIPGTSAVNIFITTKNGYTDQANVATTGITSWTFDIPQNQGNGVRVCSYYCVIYEATGKDMSVSLSPVTYRLTVNVPSHPFGASTVDIFMSTKNGYRDQANVAITGIASWTFDIPQDQGNSVQVCVNFSPSCHKYKVTGRDMLVSFREALASP